MNVNIWLTEEDATLDAKAAGLVVYHAKPPASWHGLEFQSRSHHEKQIAFLAAHGFRNTTVGYRQNRATIFDSKLFHKTGQVAFKRGYKNRRINLTLLFGRDGDTCSHTR